MIPSVGVAVLSTKRPLGQLHLLVVRQREERLGHAENVGMVEAQRGVDQVGEPGGCKDIVQAG